VAEHVFEFGPPPSARAKVVREGDDDALGRDVLRRGDALLGVPNRIGEFLERVLLQVVVVAAL